MFSLMSNLQTYYHFKLDFQKVDQHTGVYVALEAIAGTIIQVLYLNSNRCNLF